MAETSKTDLQFLEQFEPDVFWEKHGKKIILTVAAVVAMGLLFVYQQRQAEQAERDAARRLAQANDPATLQAIAQEFKGQPLAGQALLRLADLHSQAGRLAEAEAIYRDFISSDPQHPLVDSARLGQASVTEALGNFEAAREQYQQLVNKPGSYAAIAGKVGVARCTEALGQIKEARQLYEELMPVVSGTAWEAQVSIRWAVLGRNIETPTPEPPTAIPQIRPVPNP